MENIKVITGSCGIRFFENVNGCLQAGYTLSSTSCDNNEWRAILVYRDKED